MRLTGFGTGGCHDGSSDYCVKNYDNNYLPQYTLTQALAQSPNTAFVKLISSTGVTPAVDMAVKLGLRSYTTHPAAADPDKSIADYYTQGNLASFTLGPEAVDPVEASYKSRKSQAAKAGKDPGWCSPRRG